MRQTFFISLLFMISNVFGQNAAADSVFRGNILPVDVFLKLVEKNHPVARQARIIILNAEAERLKASGNFDPKLYSEIRQKYFDNKNYYDLQDYGLSVPAWFGLSAKTGYEVNDGVFLNPQQTVPGSGLWYAGLNLTLGRGLFIDERRAAIKQARLMVDAAEFEASWALNQLLQDALTQYWKWYQAYALYQIYEEAVDLADVRFNQVRANALVGEKAMIDTLEASIQLQNRIISFQETQALLIQERQMLETYLWLEGQIPLNLEDNTRPEYNESTDIFNLDAAWLENHPLLRSYGLKVNQLEVQQRLNREMLKPQLDLSYKFLNEPLANEDFFAQYSPANYSWGLGASFPIFLRKERGEIQKTGLKIQETTLDLQLKARELQNKVEALMAELRITRLRLIEIRKLVNSNFRLYQAEIIKFENGESSLFLVNQRELKYISSREKLVDLEAKVQQVEAKLKATAALLD